MYAPAQIRVSMARQGKICFRTCMQHVLIPASYVVYLTQMAYAVNGTEPNGFRVAVEHWLLCETLDAIGNHTIA